MDTAEALTQEKYHCAIQDPIHKQLSGSPSGCICLIWPSILPGLKGTPSSVMSCGTSSFGSVPGETPNYTNPDEQDTSSYDVSYGPDTGYTNPVSTQYFSGFSQSSSTSPGIISTLEITRLPPENLSQHEVENSSGFDHSSFYSSGPSSSFNYWSQNL